MDIGNFALFDFFFCAFMPNDYLYDVKLLVVYFYDFFIRCAVKSRPLTRRG